MRALQAAALAKARTAWNSTQVFAVGAVPDLPESPYLTVMVDGGRDDTMRSDATGGSDAHRLVTMAVGKSAAELGFAVEKSEAAFRGQYLTVAGLDLTPCVLESSTPPNRDPDGGGWLTLTSVYTFHVYEEN